MNKPRIISPDLVKAQIARLLIEYPELAEDQEALAMSLESETDAVDLLRSLTERIGFTNALADGLKEFIDDLKSRHEAYERRIQGMRALMFQLMDIAGLPKLDLPMATLSMRPGTRKVIITEEESIPMQFFRIKKEPDKIKIKGWLEEGNPLPGAFLSNAETVLQIRVK